jgi:predicted nucleotidyltransferase component of viral defense system
MISADELLRVAKIKGIRNRWSAEKDYLLEIALLSISRSTKDELVFKGGTCMSKFYKLDRFSEDIDFSARRDIDVGRMLEKIASDLRSFGVLAEIKEGEKKHDSINARIMCRGPLYNGSPQSLSSIKVDVNLKSGTDAEPKLSRYSPLYSEIPAFSLLVMDEREILAEKIRAVMSRGKARDVYDMWFLLEKGVPFDAGLVGKKLEFYGEKWDPGKFKRGLLEKKPFWKTELSGLVASVPDFGEAQKAILSKVRSA